MQQNGKKEKRIERMVRENASDLNNLYVDGWMDG